VASDNEQVFTDSSIFVFVNNYPLLINQLSIKKRNIKMLYQKC